MARVTRTQRRRRGGGGLRRQAASQASAEYGPQKRGVRREVRGQVRSARSMEGSLQDSLRIARREARRAGMKPDDLTSTLKDLALQSADAGAAAELAIGETRRSGSEEIRDLLAGQGQSERSILGELQAAQTARRQELADENRGRENDFLDKIRLEQALKKLGLGSYAEDGQDGKLTPTQKRGLKQERGNARFRAKQLLDAARTDPDGPGENPREWDEDVWRGLTGAVMEGEGIGDVTQAERAVEQLRLHFVTPVPFAPTPAGKEAAFEALARRLGR